MAAKSYDIEGLGVVKVYKRRGTRRMNLRVSGQNIRVSQPTWLPYGAGLQFAVSHKLWIVEQQAKQPVNRLKTGMSIGKTRALAFTDGPRLRSKVTTDQVIVYVPHGSKTDDSEVQKIAVAAIKRALKAESEEFLPTRLQKLAENYGFNYRQVKLKSMKTRWGSCTNDKKITLNIFLMMAPWELIDYVLLHELTHTKHLHHGKDFWQAVGDVMPDYKERRKKLKNFQNSLAVIS
jgi:predicted metal-dependent hydrolase